MERERGEQPLFMFVYHGRQPLPLELSATSPS